MSAFLPTITNQLAKSIQQGAFHPLCELDETESLEEQEVGLPNVFSLAMRNIATKWTTPVREWKPATPPLCGGMYGTVTAMTKSYFHKKD